MKPFIPFALLLFVCACTVQGPKTTAITSQQIETAIANGSFSKAEALIKEYLNTHALPFKEQQKWLFQIDKMNRIRMDFSATDSSVLSFIHNYYDSVSTQQLRTWEEGKALEYKIIDGKKRYFNNAARNLFRISGVARKEWERVNGNRPDSLARFLARYLPSVVNDVKVSQHNLVDPVNMEVTYTLTVKPNAVPPGELVRVWMPMPRTDIPRQTDVQLIATSQPNFVVSPDLFAHKTMYMERRAIADEPTVFTYTFSYTSYAEWYDINPLELKLYNTQSAIYQDFTSEQSPHIVFSDRIKSLTQEVVGNEQNPYLKIRKIYDWIDKSFPWASSREYSTIDNIPEYVLDNRHGDCGQVALLFITMARCAGVPAKWQSGWMMHPGNKNLHDWAEVYYEGIGWVPVDQSFGRVRTSQNPDVFWYYAKGIDAFRLIVNQDTGQDFYPYKMHPRSETVDFQRGEVEWRGGNLYFNQWRYNMDIVYRPVATPPLTDKPKKEYDGYDTQMLPFTDYGYRRVDDRMSSIRSSEIPLYINNPQGIYNAGYNNYGYGVSSYPQSSYPSLYQYHGGTTPAEDVIRNYNQRTYLRSNERGYIDYSPQMVAPASSIRNESFQYDPAQFNSYQYRYDSYPYNPYHPHSRIEDNSVSWGFPNQSGYRTEDRYVPPAERSLFPASYTPPYRRDLREESQRIQGTNPITPYTEQGYRR